MVRTSSALYILKSRYVRLGLRRSTNARRRIINLDDARPGRHE